MQDAQRNNQTGDLRKVGLGLFTAIGGALLGATLGGAAGGFLALAGFSHSDASRDVTSGIGVVLIAFIGIGIGAIAGGALGLFALPLLCLVRNLRILATILACFGYAAGIYGLLWCCHFQTGVQSMRLRADNDIRAQNHNNAQLSDAYLKVASVDLPGLLGPFYYPGATINPELDKTVDRTYPRIDLLTSDSYTNVISYYQKLVLPGETINRDGAKAVRPGDGRAIYIGAEKFGNGSVDISIFLASSIGGPQTWTTAAALPLNTPGAQAPPATAGSTAGAAVASAPSPADALSADPNWSLIPAGASLSTDYGNLVYPGSRIHLSQPVPAGSPANASDAVLATADSYDLVTSYYKPLFTVVNQTPTTLLGTCHRASDGKFTFVHISTASGLTFISLSASPILK